MKFSELIPMFVEYRVERRQHLAQLNTETLKLRTSRPVSCPQFCKPFIMKTCNKINTMNYVHDTADFRQVMLVYSFFFFMEPGLQ